MISKLDTEKKFILTKTHNIPYLLHSYSNIKLKMKNLKILILLKLIGIMNNLELILLIGIMKIIIEFPYLKAILI